MMKDNKVALSKKQTASEEGLDGMSGDQFFINKLMVSNELHQEITAKKLVYRWINASEFKRNFGSHKAYWVPYKTSIKDLSDEFGRDENGYVRRGDSILAVRSIEKDNQHKALLKNRNENYSNYQKQKAQELRAAAREAGVNTKISEGYEDEGESED